MARTTVQISGHIIDSLILPKILDLIINFGAEFEILEIQIEHSRQSDQQIGGQPAASVLEQVQVGGGNRQPFSQPGLSQTLGEPESADSRTVVHQPGHCGLAASIYK